MTTISEFTQALREAREKSMDIVETDDARLPTSDADILSKYLKDKGHEPSTPLREILRIQVLARIEFNRQVEFKHHKSPKRPKATRLTTIAMLDHVPRDWADDPEVDDLIKNYTPTPDPRNPDDYGRVRSITLMNLSMQGKWMKIGETRRFTKK